MSFSQGTRFVSPSFLSSPKGQALIIRPWTLTSVVHSSTSTLGPSTMSPLGHPFAGYYLPFPDTPFSGLVSTISDDPPVMRWIYVDRGTYEVKFGTRPWAEANFKGPFDCTRQDRRMTLGSWEGFLAVQEGNFWALYFDLDDDRLQSRVAEGTPVLEIQLQRVEMKTQKPVAPEEPPEENGKKEENDGKKEEDACNGAENGDGLESPEID